MKIEISSKNIMVAALNKARNEEYFDALCLFAQVDSYESVINQIGCHAALEDTCYAVELYRKLLARYVFTHNCVADVKLLGDVGEEVLDYIGNDLKGTLDERDPNKISADPDLIAAYDWDEDPDFWDDEDQMQEIEELGKMLAAELENDTFVDVKSPEYGKRLSKRMMRAYTDGDREKGDKLKEELLSLSTDDAQTLETQLAVCVFANDWEAAEKCALKLFNNENVTYHGVFHSIHALSRFNRHQEELSWFLKKVLELNAAPFYEEMIGYLQIAEQCLGYNDVTLLHADNLFAHYKDIGCTALKMCARVYFNCGKVELAKSALVSNLRAAPWDSVAKVMLECVNKNFPFGANESSLFEIILRNFEVPDEVALLAQRELLLDITRNGAITSASFAYLECLAKYCCGCVVSEQPEKFSKQSEILVTILKTIDFDSTENLLSFARESFTNFLPETDMNACLLSKVITAGYRGKLILSLLNGLYTLDLSKLKLDDKRFADAFAICAVLRKVNVRRLENVYCKIVQAVNVSQATDRELAYAMLALAYKGFDASDQRSFFDDTEQKVYMAYIQNNN